MRSAPLKVRPAEVSPAEARLAEVRPAEVRPAEARTRGDVCARSRWTKEAQVLCRGSYHAFQVSTPFLSIATCLSFAMEAPSAPPHYSGTG